MNSKTSHAVVVLQASDLLLQVVDSKYPGPGKSIISFAWSPFAVEKNAILVGASDRAGLSAGIEKLLELAILLANSPEYPPSPENPMEYGFLDDFY